MSKVYLVFKGEYSARRCAGVFSTEEKAKVFCDGIQGTCDYDMSEVVEFELDVCPDEFAQGLRTWRVRMNLSGSCVPDATEESSLENDGNVVVFDENWSEFKAAVFVWARDAEHAIKIGSDRINQHIAMVGLR